VNTPTLFDDPAPAAPLRPAQANVYEALARITGPADAHDIHDILADHGITMFPNVVSKRLGELEALGRVERTGRNFARKGNPTTWRTRT
jgi:hypothetical protein